MGLAIFYFTNFALCFVALWVDQRQTSSPPTVAQFSIGFFAGALVATCMLTATASMFPAPVGTIDHRSAIFATEDTLSTFIESLSKEQAGALYQLLNARGCRLDGHALSKWRTAR